ncbi:uncharacterized protein [Nicotiana tomentosiformis]|uniref:uncharacterized protein n=1 Tax=Nicotiana tomentosiformis TaxID=4098 RepID=UPI00388C58A3
MDFEEIMNTVQCNGVSQDTAYLRAFPFSLKDDASGFEAYPRDELEQVQLDVMAKEIRKLTLGWIQSERHTACDICGRGHPTHECQASTEELNAVGNYNFNAMEDLMKAFILKTNKRLETHSAAIREHGAAIKEIGTSFQNLERQFGRLAILLSGRIPRTLPDDTERNPKEILKSDDDKKKKGPMKIEKKKKEEKLRREEPEKREHMPALPFTQKLYKEKMDKQFARFLDVLKWVHVNLPFIEVLSQMHVYVKFLKEILIKKMKIEETLVVKLTEHCNAILQNKLPQKCGDLESFTIPFSVGTIRFDKSLCNSGVLINLMPLSIYRKLGKEIGEISGEYGGDQEGPLIMERPFLATGRAILDIHERKLMLRVGEKTVTFDMNVAKGAQKNHV